MSTVTASTVSLSRQALAYDSRTAIPRLGLIALSTDLTSERDFARIVPQDRAAVHVTRVAFDNPTTPENLRKMAPRLGAAAALLPPGEPLAAVCYSCTSASVVIGDESIAAAIHGAVADVPVVTPSAAARLAFRALGVGRLAILTPYLPETSRPMATYFSQHGLEVTRLECFGLEDDRDMAYVARDCIVAAALQVDNADAEALFISCTALPAIGAIAEIEARSGKPVVTSNQATGGAMLRHAGLDHQPTEFGRLFQCELPRVNAPA
ncbi:MAG: ectoine utilization protein EutA [Gammaproteobacteria bacterium]